MTAARRGAGEGGRSPNLHSAGAIPSALWPRTGPGRARHGGRSERKLEAGAACDPRRGAAAVTRPVRLDARLARAPLRLRPRLRAKGWESRRSQAHYLTRIRIGCGTYLDPSQIMLPDLHDSRPARILFQFMITRAGDPAAP